MKFEKFAEWAFYAMITALCGMGVATLKDVSNSVNDLNTKVAVVIEKNVWIQESIKSHDQRLNALERGKK